MNKEDPMVREFYDELSDAQIETLELDGRILTRRNNGKLHACKKGAQDVEFLCRSKSIRDRYGLSSALGIMDKREFVESERLCKNCKRMIQDETGLRRVVVAVGEDESIDEAIESFCQKRNKTLNTVTPQ